jgi:hypothetical protein
MTTKPPLQKILQEILHTENESKQNHERASNTKHRRKGIKSNTDSATHSQTLNQQRQLHDRITMYLPILTLNVNGLNSPIERH